MTGAVQIPHAGNPAAQALAGIPRCESCGEFPVKGWAEGGAVWVTCGEHAWWKADL